MTQQSQTMAAQAAQLQSRLNDTSGRLDAADKTNAQLSAQLADMQKQIAELDKTVQVGKDTIAAKLSDLAKLAEQNRALLALRDELEKQAQDAAARAIDGCAAPRGGGVAARAGKELGDSARHRSRCSISRWISSRLSLPRWRRRSISRRRRDTRRTRRSPISARS